MALVGPGRCTPGDLDGGRGGKEAAPPPNLAPAPGRMGVRGKQAPQLLTVLTLVLASPLVLGLHFFIWGQARPCPTYLLGFERGHANERHYNELFGGGGAWIPGSLYLLLHCESTRMHTSLPQWQVLVKSHSQSSPGLHSKQACQLVPCDISGGSWHLCIENSWE